MSNLLATPSLPKPLERVQVTDGLLITANHWQRAHQYHRQYQRLHYQALHQSGIVQGLGVCVIDAPEGISTEYRDRRWIQIQPGFAIDAWGNAIVVPEAMAFRIASEAPSSGTIVVSIVLRHVDPDQLQASSGTSSAFIQETFRIDETIHAVDENEIVLCQVTLGADKVAIQPSQNVFAPVLQELDLRDRRSVGMRSQQSIQIDTWVYTSPHQPNPWQDLIHGCASLYPTLDGTVNVQMQALTEPKRRSDLLHVSLSQLVNLSATSLQALKSSLESGTVLFIEAPTEGSAIDQLGTLQLELQRSSLPLKRDPNARGLYNAVHTEWTAVTQDLNHYLSLIHETIQTVLQSAGIDFKLPLANESATQELTGRIDRSHPLRQQPFLFDQFPVMNSHPLYVFNWGGIILTVGHLSQAWSFGHDDDFEQISREQIRTAQEFGINLLHFAARHHQRVQLQTNPNA